MAKKQRLDDRRQWPTGELTEEQIRQDARVGNIVPAIVYTVAFLAVCGGMIPWLMVATKITLRIAALLVCAAILAIRSYKSWKSALTKVEFRIEEDTLNTIEVRSGATQIGARLSDAAVRTPYFHFEKHGEYKVDAAQIHEYYIAHELVHQFEKGEQVYMVYNKATNELLHLYRKKYWKLPE